MSKHSPEHSDGLPPPECWIRDIDDKMETPVDERGLVDRARLMTGVYSYIHPRFLWPDKPSIHHLYWVGADYAQIEERSQGIIRAQQFRSLAPNLVLMPRMLHTVLHRVTLPPPIPHVVVMNEFVEGWNAASSLYHIFDKKHAASQRVSKHVTGHSDQETSQRALRFQDRQHYRLMGGVAMHSQRLERVAPPFRPVEPDATDMEVLTRLGRIISKGYHRLESLHTVRSRRGRRYRWLPEIN